MRPIRIVPVSGLAQSLESYRLQGVIVDPSGSLHSPGLATSKIKVIRSQLLLVAIHLELLWFTCHGYSLSQLVTGNIQYRSITPTPSDAGHRGGGSLSAVVDSHGDSVDHVIVLRGREQAEFADERVKPVS